MTGYYIISGNGSLSRNEKVNFGHLAFMRVVGDTLERLAGNPEISNALELMGNGLRVKEDSEVRYNVRRVSESAFYFSMNHYLKLANAALAEIVGGTEEKEGGVREKEKRKTAAKIEKTEDWEFGNPNLEKPID